MSKNRANNRDRVWNRYEPETDKLVDSKRYKPDNRRATREAMVQRSEFEQRFMFAQEFEQ